MRAAPKRLLLLVVLAPLVAAMPHALASGGPTQGDAELIEPGTYTGSVASGEARWYAVDVPEGEFLRIGFQITSGSASHAVYFVEADGTSPDRVESGSVGAWDPVGSRAWLLIMEDWLGPIDYTLTVARGAAGPQDDAGTGADAGNAPATALPLPPGSYHGSVMAEFGDLMDWYRVDAPANMVLDVGSSAAVVIYAEDDDWRGLAFPGGAAAVLTDGTPLFLRLRSPGAYDLYLSLSPAADLQVAAPVVEPAHAQTPAGAAEEPLRREVRVEVSNVGAGASREARLVVAVEHPGAGEPRVLLERAFALEPGESTVFALEWDTAGELGDVRVVARVLAAVEANGANDVASSGHAVVIADVPGVDAFNHEVGLLAAPVRTEYGGERVGVWWGFTFVGVHR